MCFIFFSMEKCCLFWIGQSLVINWEVKVFEIHVMPLCAIYLMSHVHDSPGIVSGESFLKIPLLHDNSQLDLPKSLVPKREEKRVLQMFTSQVGS